jgi:hypothetical protein
MPDGSSSEAPILIFSGLPFLPAYFFAGKGGSAATVRTMSLITSNSGPGPDRLAELLAEAAIGAGLMMAEPQGGSSGADRQADDDDRDPGGVDNLPDPCDRVVTVHVAPLPFVPLLVPGLPVSMISVPSTDRLEARRDSNAGPTA